MRKNLSELRLLPGAHEDPSEGGCMMEVAAWWAGEKHSDNPRCVDPVIGTLCRDLNDRLPGDERQSLIELIPLVTGTNDGRWGERAFLCADRAVRVFTPIALDAAGLGGEADVLRRLPMIVDVESARVAWAATKAAEDAASAAVDAASAAVSALLAAEDATCAAWAATWAATWAAEDAASAACAASAASAAGTATKAATKAAEAAEAATKAATKAATLRQLILDCVEIGAEDRAPVSLPEWVDLPEGAECSPSVVRHG